MKKLIITLAIILTLSGCGPGDRRVFANRGHVFLKGIDRVCMQSSPKDVLRFYLLTSSEDHYKRQLLSEEYIEKENPDTCIYIRLKNNINYNVIYIMNDDKYRADFSLDENNNLTEVK